MSNNVVRMWDHKEGLNPLTDVFCEEVFIGTYVPSKATKVADAIRTAIKDARTKALNEAIAVMAGWGHAHGTCMVDAVEELKGRDDDG